MHRDTRDEIRTTLHALEAHLAWWGLRQFTSDEAYFQWQREALSPAELTALHRQVERKRHGSPADEVAFPDVAIGGYARVVRVRDEDRLHRPGLV